MKVPVCEKCKKEREQLEANPKGGCAKCKYCKQSDSHGECQLCFTEYTPFIHYPRFVPKEEEK